MMREDGLAVDVLTTHATWFGMTYPQDRPYVQEQLQAMHQDGVYPQPLFKERRRL